VCYLRIRNDDNRIERIKIMGGLLILCALVNINSPCISWLIFRNIAAAGEWWMNPRSRTSSIFAGQSAMIRINCRSGPS
jgi:hypothetical protein